MKKLTFVLFVLASFLAFGQEKLTPEQSAQAWAQIEPFIKTADRATTSGMPAIGGAVPVTESQINEMDDRKVWLTYSLPGTYLLLGVTYSGEPVKLGAFRQDQIAPNIFLLTFILDNRKRSESAPFADQILYVNIFRLWGEKVEQLSVTLGVSPGPPTFKVLGEGTASSGDYYILLSGVSIEATIAVGRAAISLYKEQMPDGTIRAIFPTGTYIPPTGPATVTVCRQGNCESQVFERRVQAASTKG